MVSEANPAMMDSLLLEVKEASLQDMVVNLPAMVVSLQVRAHSKKQI